LEISKDKAIFAYLKQRLSEFDVGLAFLARILHFRIAAHKLCWCCALRPDLAVVDMMGGGVGTGRGWLEEWGGRWSARCDGVVESSSERVWDRGRGFMRFSSGLLSARYSASR